MATVNVLDMSPKKIASEYRVAYKHHFKVAEDYANGNITSAQLLASANNLKRLQAAYQIQKEDQPRTTRKANPAPRKRAAIRETKNATVNVYEMYGTRGEYAADILYRGKLLKQFAGMDLAAIFRQVETWCKNQGYAIRLNDETRRKNPATRKRAISRPSQVTKKAPTKRLVSRRKAAAKKPVKGYFPNPAKKPAPHSALPYCVQLEYEGRGWKTVAAFAAQIPAENHAHGIAKKFPDGPSIRVIKK